MADEATAVAAAPTWQFPNIGEAIGRLDTRQKVIGMAGIALVIALLVGTMLWTREVPYAVLFTISDEKDGGQIVAALQAQNIPYRFSDNGLAVLVPQPLVHDTRLRLATQGLPKGGMVGFELMENQKIGVSQFAEQINYQRALEGELARSIQSLAAVKGARVHLAIPKQTAFLRDDLKTSASILVNLHAGRSLEPIQVAGIVNLVASSVPNLNPVNVSVIDQDGKLISKQHDSLRDAGLDPIQLKYVREIEGNLVKRIEAILAPVVGSSNVRAQVTADVDFSLTDQVAETYRPNPTPETAIRSQQSAEQGNGNPPPLGVPGALTNQPPVPATAPITNPQVGGANSTTSAAGATYSRNSTVNYEVDKTIRHSKGSPGNIRRLSVAVVVNQKKEPNPKDPTKTRNVPLTEAELKQINDLAREAMGFSKDRGDSLSVANAPFTPPEKEVIPDTPLLTQSEMLALGKDGFKWLVIAGLLFYLWTKMLKPVFEKMLPPPPPPPVEEEKEEEMVEVTPIDLRNTYEGKLEAAREFARADPKAVAAMLKEWIDGEG